MAVISPDAVQAAAEARAAQQQAAEASKAAVQSDQDLVRPRALAPLRAAWCTEGVRVLRACCRRRNCLLPPARTAQSALHDSRRVLPLVLRMTPTAIPPMPEQEILCEAANMITLCDRPNAPCNQTLSGTSSYNSTACHQVLERLNAVEATLVALRSQLQATPPDHPPPPTAVSSSAASRPAAAQQTRSGTAVAPSGAAPADSAHGHWPVGEAIDGAGQHGWYDHVARMFNRKAWQTPASAKGDGGRVMAGPDAVSSAGQAAAKD